MKRILTVLVLALVVVASRGSIVETQSPPGGVRRRRTPHSVPTRHHGRGPSRGAELGWAHSGGNCSVETATASSRWPASPARAPV